MSFDPDKFFATLAHPLRLRILLLLQGEDELCVCELTHALQVSQPMISRHLAQLREAGVVQDRRAGLWIYYRCHAQLPDWAQSVLQATAAGLRREAPYRDDRQRLQAMPNRPDARCCA